MKDNFNIFGFKFNTKKFLITMGISLVVFLVLMLLDIFLIKISWYGVIIGVGFLCAIYVASENGKYRNISKDYPYDLIWFIFPLAIIGARLGYVLNALDEFPNFIDIFKIWNGGLSIVGGVVGGAIGLVICCLIKKKNIIASMDIAAPALILGQAIGRWGNFVNQEVYGFEITNKAFQWFPIGVFITKNGINQWHLALFFWESVLTIIGFIVLTKLLRKSKIKGIVVSSYFAYYGFIRAILETFRVEEFVLTIPGTNLPFSQVSSILIFIVGVALIITLLLLNKKHPNLVNMEFNGELANPVISNIETGNNTLKAIKKENIEEMNVVNHHNIQKNKEKANTMPNLKNESNKNIQEDLLKDLNLENNNKFQNKTDIINEVDFENKIKKANKRIIKQENNKSKKD